MNKLDRIKQAQLEQGDQVEYRLDQPSGLPVANTAVKDLAHYQAALSADLAKLATIKDLVEKAKAKQQMLPTYLPFVQDYIKLGHHYPNDVAVYVAIWLFDTLDIENGLEIALHLIAQKQITPPKFDRDLPTFVCDAMYDWANALLKLEQSASPYLDFFVANFEDWELAPPVKSKLYAILAKHKKREGDWLNVLALCEKAEQVNPEGAGVKTLKLEAQSKLKPAEPEKTAE